MRRAAPYLGGRGVTARWPADTTATNRLDTGVSSSDVLILGKRGREYLYFIIK
jgi:hypothetical protein